MIEDFGVLLSLIFLEALLAIDNIFSFAFLINQAPPQKRGVVKKLAVLGALFLRFFLLLLFLVIKETDAQIPIGPYQVSANSLAFFIGGLFLAAKSLWELIYFGSEDNNQQKRRQTSMLSLVIQIILIDFVFSVDSILAAITITDHIYLIVISILLSIIVLYYGSSILLKLIDISWRFHVLGLLLVCLIGMTLIVESFQLSIDKNLLIATIIFSCLYETLLTYYQRHRKMKPLDPL